MDNLVGMISLHYPEHKVKSVSLKEGCNQAVTNRLVELRELTSMSSFKEFSELNIFFIPFVKFCMTLVGDQSESIRRVWDLIEDFLNSLK